MNAAPNRFEEPRQTRFSSARVRFFHWYFLLRRPMTLGARAMVRRPEDGAIFLIRHTYVPGWQLPGGGVETGETFAEAVTRELREEGNIELTHPPILRSLHFNKRSSKRDHVAFYLVEDFRQATPKMPDREIAEAGFFTRDKLPEGVTLATRARIAEVFDGAPASPYW